MAASTAIEWRTSSVSRRGGCGFSCEIVDEAAGVSNGGLNYFYIRTEGGKRIYETDNVLYGKIV